MTTPMPPMAITEAVRGLLISAVRTFVPYVVGYLATIGVDDGTAQTVSMILVSLAYYVAVRLFELYLSPALGWLLGWAKAPGYEAKV